MKYPFLFILLGITGNMFSQTYSDPNFPKPASGYGSDGPNQVAVVSYNHPYFSGQKIEIFHPDKLAGAVPTLFFCHGFGGTNSIYVKGMLQFIAKKGYAVVYVPYPTTGVSIEDRYNILVAGFRHAARNYSNIIDTNKVGFVGHSFGGGAIFGVGFRCFSENNWGKNGRLLFALAPWYSYQIAQSQLQNYPADTKLIMQVYDQDIVNDHRMAIDIFKNINISNSEKDYILVRPDTVGGHVYKAGHDLPGTQVAFDALDYYAFYRLLDALCDYTFNGNPTAKTVALGNGSAQQITMPGTLKPLVQSDNPLPVYAESSYEYSCSGVLNPRKSYCQSVTAVREISANRLIISPNPVENEVIITLPEGFKAQKLDVFNIEGRLIYRQQLEGTEKELTLQTDSWEKGVYIVRIGRYVGRVVKAF